jgi:hypothetical protein
MHILVKSIPRVPTCPNKFFKMGENGEIQECRMGMGSRILRGIGSFLTLGLVDFADVYAARQTEKLWNAYQEAKKNGAKLSCITKTKDPYFSSWSRALDEREEVYIQDCHDAFTAPTTTTKVGKVSKSIFVEKSATSLLKEAIANEDMRGIRYYLAAGADINATMDYGGEFNGGTLLMRALYTRNKKIITFLLKQPGIAVNAKDSLGKTAFMHAVKVSKPCFGAGDKVVFNPEIMELLLRSSADINEQDNLGATALMQAFEVSMGWNMLFGFLLKQTGINLELKDNQGRTALIRAFPKPVIETNKGCFSYYLDKTAIRDVATLLKKAGANMQAEAIIEGSSVTAQALYDEWI